MPRPKEGYKNAAGQQVPGVSDVLTEYMPKPALVQWAYKRGVNRLPLYEKGVLDIGTAVHAMAELDLKGRQPREIEAKLHELLFDQADLAKAWHAYEAFCRWREKHAVRAISQEVSLVSEIWSLGGTPDCIGYIDGEIGLLDLKTCTTAPARPYAEQLMAMAAHATLWNEANPNQLVRTCHILYLPKDGSAHRHHAHANYADQWEEFAHLLRAYQTKHSLPMARLREETARAVFQSELAAKGMPAEPFELTAPAAPPSRPRGAVGSQGVLFVQPPAKKRPALSIVPKVKPRVRLRADGSWSLV